MHYGSGLSPFRRPGAPETRLVIVVPLLLGRIGRRADLGKVGEASGQADKEKGSGGAEETNEKENPWGLGLVERF